MSNVDDLAYFTGVLKRLDALTDRHTDDDVLFAMATEAKSYVGALVGCLIPESEDASPVQRMAARVAEIKSANTRPRWNLKMTNAAREWTDAATFETLAGAASRIIELEGYPTHGVFLNFHVLAGSLPDTDEQALHVFHHTGKRALYGIRRARAN